MRKIESTRRMTEEELNQYRETVVTEYEKELSATNVMSAEDARKLAISEVNRFLPDGAAAQEYHIDIVINDLEEEVGLLWYGKRTISEMEVAFIYDIIVYENYRRAGYGQKMIAYMEESVKKEGLDKIVLNVFANNLAANALYERMGFTIISEERGQRAMIKYL